jgi:hypothetical protein
MVALSGESANGQSTVFIGLTLGPAKLHPRRRLAGTRSGLTCLRSGAEFGETAPASTPAFRGRVLDRPRIREREAEIERRTKEA